MLYAEPTLEFKFAHLWSFTKNIRNPALHEAANVGGTNGILTVNSVHYGRSHMHVTIIVYVDHPADESHTGIVASQVVVKGDFGRKLTLDQTLCDCRGRAATNNPVTGVSWIPFIIDKQVPAHVRQSGRAQ